MFYKVRPVRPPRTRSTPFFGKGACCLAVGFACTLASERASASEPPSVDARVDSGGDIEDFEGESWSARGLLRTRAETVSFDAKTRSLELVGDVHVDAPPFHLRADRITLTRTKLGIDVVGQGRVAFCPCLGTPLTIEFSEAIVAPPGDLILRSPKLEIYDVPVLWLPWFWLRSDDRMGVLPPDIAYRGQDGWYFGGGVHVPWKEAGEKHALDLRAGGYAEGGFVVDGRLRTESTTTLLRFDRLERGRAPALADGSMGGNTADGLTASARGASTSGPATMAWDVDMIRGRRGVAATTDLDAAAKPWDRTEGTASLRLGPILAETGYRAVTRRGGDLTTIDAAGPFAALRTSGAIASGIVYDATVEGGSLHVVGAAAGAQASDTLSYGRAEVGGLAATYAGPLAASIQARAAGDLALEGRGSGGDRAATVRARLELPVGRSFAWSEDGNPWVHVVDPFVEGSVLHSRGNAVLGALPGRGLAAFGGTAPVTDAGVNTSLGHWGHRDAIEVMAAGGAAYGIGADSILPLARTRLSATFTGVGGQLETAHVAGRSPFGHAVVTRLRIGHDDGLRLLTNVAMRDSIDPVLARALTDPTTEAPAGWLAREGTTGGAGVVVPWTRSISTSAAVDADLTHTELVAARGGIELRDQCHCLVVRATAAHRIGREGVDVWLALDFTTDR
jgi:hypothetical protein